MDVDVVVAVAMKTFDEMSADAIEENFDVWLAAKKEGN